jgi:glycosyltransferase involved in cell wall biosynthesis
MSDLVEVTKQIYWSYTNLNEDQLPKVSIFTPTHNAEKFIAETWEAVREQTYENFEWVIVDDGSTDDTVKILKEFRAADPRIKIFEFPPTNRIGYLKKAATGLCTGSILVELDHDDWLTTNCLQRVVDTFATDPKIGMVYSNSAEYYRNRAHVIDTRRVIGDIAKQSGAACS